VAIKPGMPNYLGTSARGKGNKAPARLLFGLPGNPVAALVSFHLFVRPALLKMAGAPDPKPRFIGAKLSSNLKKKHNRLEWVRGVMAAGEGGELVVGPTCGQASHMLGGLAAANCLIEFPADRDVLGEGDEVRVMMLNWERG
jgi:molybdopterin molybdotransferase